MGILLPFFVLCSLLMIIVADMRAAALVLPSVLAQQVVAATTGRWQPSEESTLFDPDQNKLGAVASESSICSDIGIDILKAGGNAADSMVATTFCVGVIGMYAICVSSRRSLD